MIARALSAGFIHLALVGAAWGQSININFGPPGAGPADDYAAAGLPGVWNSIEGENTPFQDPQIIYNLVGLDGSPTAATLYQFGGTELLNDHDPSVAGDDAVLLNDCVVTHTQNLETCLFINGLANGTYEVLTYAWMPNHPEALARVRMDFTPNIETVGGVWPGGHVEGVTYARHLVEVTNGFIGAHSGNVAGANLEIGAALNGIQLRLLEDCAEPYLLNGMNDHSFEQVAFDGYIDPRAESSDGVHVDLGLSEITLAFSTPVSDLGGDELTAASFSISETGPNSPPQIVAVETDDDTVVTLQLSRPISLQQWTTVHTSAVSQCSGAPITGMNSLTVGFLPCDLLQDGWVHPFDLLRFRQIVNGVGAPPELGLATDYVDTDRNGAVQPFDLLRFRQLLNGVSPSTQPWMNQSLP